MFSQVSHWSAHLGGRRVVLAVGDDVRQVDRDAFVVVQEEMREALAAHVLVQVHVAVLDLDFYGFANTITEQNEVLLARLAPDPVLVIVQTVLHLDLREALLVFLRLVWASYTVQVEVGLAFGALEVVLHLFLAAAVLQHRR